MERVLTGGVLAGRFDGVGRADLCARLPAGGEVNAGPDASRRGGAGARGGALGKQKAESRKQKAESTNGGAGTVLALVILLAVAAVWQAEMGHVFQSHGQGRWSGP
jgi:hypothetical protein